MKSDKFGIIKEIIKLMKKNTKKILFILFIIYVAAVLRITVFRNSFSLHNLFRGGSVNPVLFKGYLVFVRSKSWYRLIYLFVGNIVWFVPFGMYLQYTGKFKNILTVTFCGMLFSICIETMQFIFGTGVTELDDVVLNTFGAFIGAVCVKLFNKIHNS